MIPAVLWMAGALIGSGLVFGGLMALVAIAFAQDRAQAVQLIADGYYLLASLMPLALWFVLSALRDRAEYVTTFALRWRALLTTVQGALIGSMLGAGPLFLAAVVNVLTLWANFDVNGLDVAVRDEIVWSRLLIVVSAAVVAAFPLGLWANFVGADGKER